MSIQFGVCNLDGGPLDTGTLDRASEVLARYRHDTRSFFRASSVALLYQSFQTTEESPQEAQPHTLQSGTIIVWDGRLDNRRDLMVELGGQLSACTTDVEIVAAAYLRWNMSCFGKLIGDWAMSVWDPETRSVSLARDFAGIRHLYYLLEKGYLSWSTVLDPLVLLSGHSFELEEEYVAGWLSFFPDAVLTPYRGIREVRPGSYIQFTDHGHRTAAHWAFTPGKYLHYRSDAEYEEHFRDVFRKSVKRRLRSNFPVLAELSGGMDSSAIVCVADEIISGDGGPQLDTLSYYDDSEPNWNERPCIALVENKRGHRGHHINLQGSGNWQPFSNDSRLAWTPAFRGNPTEADRQFETCLNAGRNRVVLSGIGGDEMLGGVPTALPELADLLARAKFGIFIGRLKAWALTSRRPWWHLFRDTVRLFLPGAVSTFGNAPAPWLAESFAGRNQAALRGYRSRLQVFGPLPSLQENLLSLEALRRQIASSAPPSDPPHEYRYPYLDRDILEFLFAIPREQLIRPGQRRSLMRRAFKGVVPDEVLNRKRKAFVSRTPVIAITAALAELQDREKDLILGSLGIVDAAKLASEMAKVGHGREVAIVPILRALVLESWLRRYSGGHVLSMKQVEESSLALQPHHNLS